MAVVIQGVEKHSPAWKAGIRAGERLCAINSHPIADVLDYRFYMLEERLTLQLEQPDGGVKSVKIRKQEYEELGLEFETYLMDRQHSCKNKCIFCFVDQMPPGMRESLYFKDDDSRLSFLFGNYITMTNLQPEDIQRIIKMHISPVNISVHTMNPELRVKLMANPRAATSLEYMKELAAAGIKMNTQLVLCPGINDGPELDRSLHELAALYPAVESIACVPVGVTKYREKLFPMPIYQRETARQVLRQVNAFGDRFEQEHGVRLAYPSDEFYLLAEQSLPKAEYYGDFDQLENGVGMLALLKSEFASALENSRDEVLEAPRKISTATGAAAYETISCLAKLAMEQFDGLEIKVNRIENHFFGETITVSGLITGQDLVEQLSGKHLGDGLLIPSVMLRHEKDRFLDDMTLPELSRLLGVPVHPVDNDGWELLDAMTGARRPKE